jgi:hypothetical protein
MKTEYRAHNVCKWEAGMCVYKIADIKRYINSLKAFASNEKEKNKLTVSEHGAIIQEIEAWNGIIGLIGRIDICGSKNNN